MTLKNKDKESTLGARIADARKNKGYTQEEFSQLLGVSPQAVSKWENDISCPDIMLLPKISELLEISTDELLTGKMPNMEDFNKRTNTNVDISKLKLRIRVLTPNKKPVNISVPAVLAKKVAKLGNGISGIVGTAALTNEQIEQIFALIDEGVTGEILNIVSDDDTNVIIEIS